MHRRHLGSIALLAGLAASCGTVDVGDNIVPPELALDEDFFFCRVQPEVLGATSCASGDSGEAGECHADRSSLRLSTMAESDPPPACDGDNVVGPVPMSYELNFQAVQFTVQSDALSSPLYRRPIGLDSHPRIIFDEASPEAQLIFDWIAMGGT